jgi:hypothetical protein
MDELENQCMTSTPASEGRDGKGEVEAFAPRLPSHRVQQWN